MKRRKTSKRWVETGPLASWMVRYAQWLAGEPGAELAGTKTDRRARHPGSAVRVAKASFFATRVVQQELVRKLEQRVDFREYWEKLRADTAFHAKELGREQIAANFEARHIGLERALDKQTDEKGVVSYGTDMDVRAVEHYTRPFVELAFPKKTDHDQKAPRIVINITSGPERTLLERVLDGEPEDGVDYEIIPNDKLLTDGED